MRLLVIGHTWPEPETTGAGVRMEQLLRAFRTSGYAITFASAAERGPYSMDLDLLDIRSESIKLNDPSFDEFVTRLQPDVVLFDRFMVEEQYGWRVREQCPGAIHVLDTEDLHSLRESRRKAAGKSAPHELSDWLDSDLCKRELASIWRCDLSLLISDYEYTLLREQGIPEDLLELLPFLPTIPEAPQPGFTERRDFIFFGNGKHRPNLDAIRTLSELWKGIKTRLPAASIRIYGAYLPEDIRALHDPSSGFLVEGWVKDAFSQMKTSRVQLAPLNYGAGMKGKVVLAMQAGTPTVTTAIGAEGIGNAMEFPGAIAEAPHTLIDQAVHLYTQQEAWEEARDKAARLLKERFDSTVHIRAFIQKLEKLRDSLEQHRRKNLVGSILRHQSLGASRYLSKYIEQKNKNANPRGNSTK